MSHLDSHLLSLVTFLPLGAGLLLLAMNAFVNVPADLWRGIGILVSYLADAPFLLSGGFPQGRIFC